MNVKRSFRGRAVVAVALALLILAASNGGAWSRAAALNQTVPTRTPTYTPEPPTATATPEPPTATPRPPDTPVPPAPTAAPHPPNTPVPPAPTPPSLPVTGGEPGPSLWVTGILATLAAAALLAPVWRGRRRAGRWM